MLSRWARSKAEVPAAILFTLSLLAPLGLAAAPKTMRAGIARVDITPSGPIFLSGYAARTHSSIGVLSPIWAKAMAIDDGKGGRVVIVTTDLIGLPRSMTELVSARAMKEYGLERAHILFNSSHTHTGPIVSSNLPTMFDLFPEDADRVEAYGRKLTADLFSVIGAALADLSPADISYGFGIASFAVNRRAPGPNGFHIGVNATGPVDRSVPVIRINGPDGKLRAVLFGYACHNTTLTADFYEISGDYAGFAQAAFEAEHPGATALFLMLCGGDQNPNPRSTVALARQYGNELAEAAERVLAGDMESLDGPIRTAFELTELTFAPHTKEDFDRQLSSSNPAEVRRAQAMLRAYRDRLPVRRTPYPVQAVRFGRGLTILALGGEVVIDYDLRAKGEYAGTDLVVAGYSNDVMSYIPSRRVLKEGGYEANESMIYYGQPGPFADDVEDRVFELIHRVMKRVGISK